MKIVHQVLSGEIAGGQLVALQLAQGAAAAGHEPLLVTPSPGPLLDRAAAAGIGTAVIPLGRSFRADDAWRYARELRRFDADLLHTHTHLAGNVLGRTAGRLARIPVVAHMHIENAFRNDPVTRFAQIRLDNATARLCAHILVVSDATRAALVQQGYPRRLLHVVHNGIDLRSAAPVRLVEAPTILHVGRLAPVKGQRELIDALPDIPDAHVILVGEDLERGGAYERDLREHAARARVSERVVFAGRRDDVPALLAGCNVFALPSHAEGLPLVVLEAMAQSRPVVATRVGGTAEAVVNGETGVLVGAGRANELAFALRELLGDQDRARRLGEAGRRRVEQHFSADAMVRAVLEVYDDVVRKMAA